MTFHKDLKFGKSYEKKFLDIKKITNYESVEGCFLPYDILDLDTSIKYEVKSDRMANRTGNICIEYTCNGKLSGISTSESDFYIYFIVLPDEKHDLYEIPTDFIKKMIKDKKYFKNIKGGDKYKNDMYLFKIKIFEDFKTS